jgi:hypothetical protein
VHPKLSFSKKVLKFKKLTLTAMTKEEYLAIASEKYDELQALNKIDNFYDYEKEFEKIFIDLARTVLEENLGKPSADRRKKKHSQSSDT